MTDLTRVDATIGLDELPAVIALMSRDTTIDVNERIGVAIAHYLEVRGLLELGVSDGGGVRARLDLERRVVLVQVDEVDDQS